MMTRIGTTLLTGAILLQPTGATPIEADEIVTHDNRTEAGTLQDKVLTIRLVAAPGTWFPEEKDGPGHDVYAFGEEGGPLSNPGPMIRVPVGTEIRMTVRNAIPDAPLTVHGLHDRPGGGRSITVPAGATHAVTFRVSTPGTYFYWGSTRETTALQRRYGVETQLSGVLIVDPPEARTNEHVIMIGIEDDSGSIPAERLLYAAALNGLAWPHSLRSTVTVGDTVRMRWINATDRGHPIHLHGFYFRVAAKGDISGDTIYAVGQERTVVTEFLAPGQTMSVSWVPERPGNWLMHCHNAAHMSPKLRRGPHAADAHEGKNHTTEVMAGLVTGWHVLPADDDRSGRTSEAIGARQLRLHVQASPPRVNGHPALGFVLQNGAVAPREDSDFSCRLSTPHTVPIAAPVLAANRLCPSRLRESFC